MTPTHHNLLNTSQVADMLGVKSNTVESWRAHGRGPAFIRIGGLVRYRQSAIDEYLHAQTVDPTLPPAA